jgi:hypothetical protein
MIRDTDFGRGLKADSLVSVILFYRGKVSRMASVESLVEDRLQAGFGGLSLSPLLNLTRNC